MPQFKKTVHPRNSSSAKGQFVFVLWLAVAFQ